MTITVVNKGSTDDCQLDVGHLKWALRKWRICLLYCTTNVNKISAIQKLNRSYSSAHTSWISN